MTDYSKFRSWLKLLPFWARCVVMFLISALVVLASMFASSCGTPKTIATVHNVNPNSSVTVSMTVSNSTSSAPSVDVSPVVPSELL